MSTIIDMKKLLLHIVLSILIGLAVIFGYAILQGKKEYEIQIRWTLVTVRQPFSLPLLSSPPCVPFS